MSRIRNLTLLGFVLAAILPAAALAEGSCTNAAHCTRPYGIEEVTNPSVIVAPKGVYRAYVGQFTQVAAICRYESQNSGIWTPEQQTGYFKLVNSFDSTRDRLDRRMARKKLGFAPTLSDWTSIKWFKRHNGTYIALSCPVG